MSKYMTFESQSFANGDLLLEALSEIGFTSVAQGKDLPSTGGTNVTPGPPTSSSGEGM